MIAFCGLTFPNGEPLFLVPENAEREGTASITFPSRNDDAGFTLHFLGDAYEFVKGDFAVPFRGHLLINRDGEDAPCEVINIEGEIRPARVFIYRNMTVEKETWLGLVAFEEDEPAINLASNSRDLRIPPRTEEPDEDTNSTLLN